jgi:chromosome segregation ATPase
MTLEAELFDQRARQQILSDERERFARELEEVRTVLKTEEASREAITYETEALHAQLAERSGEVHHLREQMVIRFRELAALTQLIEEVEGKLQQSEKTVRTKEALLATREEKLLEARKSAKAARLDASKLEKRIGALLGSTSWRMTEPLRRLTRAVRR